MALPQRVAVWCLPGVLLPFLAGASFAGPGAAPAKDAGAGKLMVYVGTYTGGGSKGIYRLELDLASGQLSAPVLAARVESPSFLAIHPNRRFLYAVSEVGSFGGKKSGAVSAFAIDPRTGDLTLLNRQPSGGPGPCYVVTDARGRQGLAANYTGG